MRSTSAVAVVVDDNDDDKHSIYVNTCISDGLWVDGYTIGIPVGIPVDNWEDGSSDGIPADRWEADILVGQWVGIALGLALGNRLI